MLLTPELLGADIDDGIENLLSAISFLRTLPEAPVEIRVFATGSNHFHIVCSLKTSIPLRVMMGDDPNRIAYSKRRGNGDGFYWDYLSEEKNGKKRVRCELLEGLYG